MHCALTVYSALHSTTLSSLTLNYTESVRCAHLRVSQCFVHRHYNGLFKLRFWNTFGARIFQRACTIYASSAVQCRKCFAARNFCTQQCSAGAKNACVAHFSAKKLRITTILWDRKMRRWQCRQMYGRGATLARTVTAVVAF